MTATATPRYRGEEADRPTEIPARGWWDVSRRIFKRVGDENLAILAAGTAFYGVLAIFPFLGAIVTLYAVVADPGDVQSYFSQIRSLLPEEVADIFEGRLRSIAASADGRIGFGLIFGFLFAVWSAHRGIVALVTAITVAYHENDTRNFFVMNAFTYLLTFGAIIMVVAAMLVMIGVPAILSLLPLGITAVWITRAITWSVFFLLIIFALGILYRYGPPRRPASWRWLSLGSLAATAFWLAGSVGFSVYVSNFGSYNQSYGALGAIIVLLLWFFMSSFAVMLGALINAELELQTMRDTTIGPERPRGERGAYVADTCAVFDKEADVTHETPDIPQRDGDPSREPAGPGRARSLFHASRQRSD